jgi:hypothetical protein
LSNVIAPTVELNVREFKLTVPVFLIRKVEAAPPVIVSADDVVFGIYISCVEEETFLSAPVNTPVIVELSVNVPADVICG